MKSLLDADAIFPNVGEDGHARHLDITLGFFSSDEASKAFKKHDGEQFIQSCSIGEVL